VSAKSVTLSNGKKLFGALSRTRTLRPAGLIEPCLPTRAGTPPAGPGWLHEIKHDGFRMIVRWEASRVRLYTRHGNDWTARYPLIVSAVSSLRCRSCLIDGEVVVTDDRGLSDFERLRSRRHDHRAFLYAFDLVELQVSMGRTDGWIKSKNPGSPAVTREATEDWGQPRCGRRS
jgi:ATP-dependent DNA ligase